MSGIQFLDRKASVLLVVFYSPSVSFGERLETNRLFADSPDDVVLPYSKSLCEMDTNVPAVNEIKLFHLFSGKMSCNTFDCNVNSVQRFIRAFSVDSSYNLINCNCLCSCFYNEEQFAN